MRVLLVTDTFPPDINGVAGTLRTLSHGLMRLGHHVQVVTTREAADAQDCIARRVVTSVPLPGYPGLRVGMASTRYMAYLIEDVQPHVLYVATETPLGIAAIRAAQRAGLPVVSGFHTNFHSYMEDYHLPGLETVVSAFLRTVHNHTVRTLTPSADTARELEKWGVENVGILGRGVDTDTFTPEKRDPALRARWGASEKTPVAMYVGRIAPEKNLELAARAFEAFREVHPGAPCVFVGDGPRLRWLQAEFPDFVYAGARTGGDLARHYASADVFIFPSVSETFGNVVLEALASGLVTLSFDYAAPGLLVEQGRNGWLAPFGDEAAFLGLTRSIARQWNDPALRREARETALANAWNRIIAQFERELADACGHQLPVTT
jgi:glycosyltransferase involved in cell wall biosynthesis